MVTTDDDLGARLEAAEAVALQVRALEVRIEILEKALLTIREHCNIKDRQPYRHLQTLCTLALCDKTHEGIWRDNPHRVWRDRKGAE